MFNKSINMSFLNSLLFIAFLYSVTPTYSVPVEVIPSQGIVYPIHVACECDFDLYVDGKKLNQVGLIKAASEQLSDKIPSLK
jgi:hypothetical protein